MKLIIDIDEDVRVAITRIGLLRISDEMQKEVDRAIQKGTPLPKGHGRLMILPEDAVKREQHIVSFSRQKWISEIGLSNATVAIIEADEAECEE